MTTIEISVSDETIARYGDPKAIAAKLERLLLLEELSIQAQGIHKAIQEAGVDWEEVAEEARQAAWDKYKYKIRDKLPPEAFD